jgi:trimeric autotransporter adhesin
VFNEIYKEHIRMPALTIRYRKTLSLALANNAINFTESSMVGHRVQIPMSVDYLNTFFVWQRPSGSPRPIGHFLSEVNSLKFIDVLISSLNKSYTDIDGSAGGLNYSSYILDANYDSRVRCDGVSSNDIIMAYILYKCYGTSAAPTMDIIYNLEDAQKMITSEQVASVIVDALNDDEQLALGTAVDKGGVDAMFRYILASNPLRYFKADGTQIDGLFETNFACGEADPRGQGPWGFLENDVVEMRLNFSFPKDVTHTTADDLGGNRTVVIPAGSNFSIRLQILATDTPTGATSKQAAAAAAEAAALGLKEAAAASSMASASVAAAMAEQQRQAAAYRTTVEEEAYTRAVNENARQAIAVSNAQATAAAAFSALQQAIISGSTETSIQNLRNAAMIAAAAAARAEIIATQAATTLQYAENSKAAAEQALTDAETAAAITADASATANSITVAAALAKAQADAATIAAARTAAEEASDPDVRILTDAENKLLNPNLLTALRLALNSANAKSLDAWANFTKAKNAHSLVEKKLAATTMDLNCAILANKSEGEINILQSRLTSLIEAKATVVRDTALATTALIMAQSNEKGALDDYTTTATQAARLADNVAKSALTHATTELTTTTAALVTATSTNTTAQTALTTAQAALTAAIAGGATMGDVSVLRTAVVTKTAAAKTAAAALSAAGVAKLAAQSEVTSLTDAAASAAAKITSVEDEIADLIDSYTASVAALESYENSLIVSADSAALANQLNESHLRVVNASAAADLAISGYDVAKRQYDVAAKAQVPDAGLIAKLNSYVLDAIAKKDATAAALAAAQADYTTAYTGVTENANSKSILDLAATNFTTSVENAKKNNLALVLYDAIAASNEAENLLDTKQTEYTLAQNALNSAISATATIDEIRSLNITLGTARDAYLNATTAYNAAQAAVTVAQQGVTLSVDSADVLTNVALLQRGQQVIEKANALVDDITAKYADAAATNQELLTAKQNYTIASAALVQAVKAGKNLTEILPLQAALQKASIELTRLTYLSGGKNLALTDALARGTQDPIAKAKIDSSTVVIQVASIVSKINTLNAMLIKLNEDKFTAKTAFDMANEKLIVARLALDVAITSGKTIPEIQALQLDVQAATNMVVSTQTEFTRVTAASTQASLDVNALTAEETTILASSTKTPLVDAIAALTAANAAITLESKRTAADIMAASVVSQATSLRVAQNNLTSATEAVEAAQDAYDTAKDALEDAIAAGTDLDGLKDVLSAEQAAAADLANAQAVVTSATKAFTTAQTTVASAQSVATILASIALAAGV